MHQLRTEMERFKNFPFEGEDYVFGRLYSGDYYLAYGSYFPFLKTLPYGNRVNKTGAVYFYKTIEELIDVAIGDVYSLKNSYDTNQERAEKILYKLEKYEQVFDGGLQVDLENEELIMESTSAEAAWGLVSGTIKNNKDKFPPGTIREIGFGKKIYLVTKQGMEFVFGPAYEIRIGQKQIKKAL